MFTVFHLQAALLLPMHRHARQTVRELISRQSSSQAQLNKSSGSRSAHIKATALKQPRPLPQEHLQELNNLTNEIIGRTGDGDQRGWQHTKSLRGEEKRLAQAVKDGQSRVSMAQQEFNAPAPEDDESSPPTESDVLPGTFVEVRRCVLSKP